MGKKTGIEWCDSTWNPTVGCSRVSEGCRHCYAERMAKRLSAMGRPEYKGLLTQGRWDGAVRTLPERLEDPLRWRKPARVFVDSMSDLFHEHVPVSFIAAVFETMASWRLICRKRDCGHGDPECYEDPGHTYLILTKRPERMKAVLLDELPEYVSNYYPGDSALSLALAVGDWPLKNVWLGVSVENQAAADERIPLLLETPAAVRVVSCEPLLGPVDLTRIKWAKIPVDPANYRFGAPAPDEIWSMNNALIFRPADEYNKAKIGLDWVIVGGESGPGARPMAYEWVESILDQCLSAGVPFFFKHWGEWYPSPYQGSKTDHGGYPYDSQTNTIRVGRKKAGRLLDGRTWDQYPETGS